MSSSPILPTTAASSRCCAPPIAPGPKARWNAPSTTSGKLSGAAMRSRVWRRPMRICSTGSRRPPTGASTVLTGSSSTCAGSRRSAALARCPETTTTAIKVYRKVYKDCLISYDASRYQVPPEAVGKKVLLRIKDGVIRIYDDDRLLITHTESPEKGRMITDPGHHRGDPQAAPRTAAEDTTLRPPQGQGHAGSGQRQPVSPSALQAAVRL